MDKKKVIKIAVALLVVGVIPTTAYYGFKFAKKKGWLGKKLKGDSEKEVAVEKALSTQAEKTK